jgi:hypothetical protein
MAETLIPGFSLPRMTGMDYLLRSGFAGSIPRKEHVGCGMLAAGAATIYAVGNRTYPGIAVKKCLQ